MSQIINVSGGAIEFTWPITITETTGLDISSDEILVNLGSFLSPVGAWYTPKLLRPTRDSGTFRLLIGKDVVPAAGDYYIWISVQDSPELIIRRGPKLTIT